jgi:hypothetical protein
MEESNLPLNSGSVYPPAQVNYVVKKETLPNSVTALVMGIVSLATMAYFGWILGIIAMNNAKKALQISEQNPGRYSDISLSMMRAGRTMGLIGIIMGLVGILVWILYFVFIFLIIDFAEHGGHNHFL